MPTVASRSVEDARAEQLVALDGQRAEVAGGGPGHGGAGGRAADGGHDAAVAAGRPEPLTVGGGRGPDDLGGARGGDFGPSWCRRCRWRRRGRRPAAPRSGRWWSGTGRRRRWRRDAASYPVTAMKRPSAERSMSPSDRDWPVAVRRVLPSRRWWAAATDWTLVPLGPYSSRKTGAAAFDSAEPPVADPVDDDVAAGEPRGVSLRRRHQGDGDGRDSRSSGDTQNAQTCAHEHLFRTSTAGAVWSSDPRTISMSTDLVVFRGQESPKVKPNARVSTQNPQNGRGGPG